MKTSVSIIQHNIEWLQLIKCLAAFFPIASLLLWGIHTLRQSIPVFYNIALLVFGWVCWTFAEYFTHRFLLHPKHAISKHGKGRHHEHHLHPGRIKITGIQRLAFLLVLIVLLVLNMLSPGYTLIITGLFSGFVWYCHMHVFLHKKWAAKVFPRLQLYHVFHHCKYPDRCFGVSVYWWDHVFRTIPPQKKEISKRVLNFYFTGIYNKSKTN